MKKLLNVLFLFMIVISLCACSAKQESGNANMPNPMVEYSSLEEINKKVGSSLIKPPVMGVSDEKFFVIDEKLADYQFSLNGLSYDFRASKDLSQDISGIYVGQGTMFSGEVGKNYYSDKEYHGFNFFIDDVQYTFTVKDDGQLSDEQFNNITDEIYDVVCTSVSDQAVVSLVGEYQDSTSQRAQAEISLANKNVVSIYIGWANSVDNKDEWVINATYNNGKLEYGMGDIVHMNVTYNEDGSVKEVLEADDAIPGYFEVIDGKVCWTGSGDKNTETCVFER